MTKKRLSSHLSVLFLSLALVIFCAIISGGCGGGGSGGLSSGGNDGYTPEVKVNEEDSAVREVTELTIAEFLGLTSDEDGKPYFLDFYGVPQNHINNSASTSSFITSSATSSVAAVAEKSVTVPSMMWFDRLRTEAEGGNVYSVPLEKGIEYTFEFSRNLTEDLSGLLSNISFYDPSNSLLSLDVAVEIEDIERTAYPKENPSIICYTFTPEVSGNYIFKITDGERYSGIYLDDSDNVQSFTPESDSGAVLFIYKERRNEKGEAGYYTKFKIKDDGSTTDAISINDIIQLRKLFYEANPTYFEKVYGKGLADDDYGYGDVEVFEMKMTDDQAEYYASFIEHVLANLGVSTLYLNLEDYLTSEDLALLETYSAVSSDESLDQFVLTLLENAGALDDDNEIATKILKRTIASSSAVSLSALDDEPAAIPSDITGIPYNERYHMGRGAMAHTFLDPPGGVNISLTEAYDASQKKQRHMQNYLNVTSTDTAITDNKPQATDTQEEHPITTEFYAKFINTASQSESLSKTSANVSLALSALGVTFGTGSTNNFKFGLTSTTLVIHYEEREVNYRTLTTDELEAAWKKAEFFDMINEDYNSTGMDFVKDFRNDFGDYYVSGYQYGACFDAYIAITTQTSEQLKEVESKLGASLNLDSFKSSADISNTTKDTLKENKATVTINIVTSGMGKGVPKPVTLPVSNDINAMDNVFSELLKFRNALGTSANRAGYAPIRVKMTRWRSNPKVARRMRRKGDKTGYIPLTIGQTIKISGFNTQLTTLRAYRNVVMDNSAIDGNATGPLEKEFNEVITMISGAGDRFYNVDNQASFDKTVTQVDSLTQKFKALADRYTFYTKLVIAQKQEKETYDLLKKMADAAGEGSKTAYDNVRKMPFGEEHGGSSGYKEYGVSEYVDADIDKGNRDYKAVHIARPNSSAWRIEWTHHDQQADSVLTDAGYNQPAKLTASTTDNSKAVFCYVKARSSNADSKDDRARWLVDGSPAVGTGTVNFYFKSGYSSSIDWEIEGKSMSMTRENYPFAGLIAR